VVAQLLAEIFGFIPAGRQKCAALRRAGAAAASACRRSDYESKERFEALKVIDGLRRPVVV